MPELPEVESVCLGLKDCLNQEITAVKLSPPPLLASLVPTDSLDFNLLLGESLRSVERRGKYMLWRTGQYSLLGHLGMSGVLLWQQELRPHTHWILTTAQGSLCYSDPRRFGFWRLAPVNYIHKEWESLGPDALLATAQDWQHRAQKSRRSLKDILLDQKVVAGIGNIYASEILFAAGLSPFKPACELQLADWERIATETQRILNASIAQRGTTFSDYRLTNGKDGEFQSFLKVFQKKNQPCPHCKRPISQATQQGRSTFWCEGCQI